MAVIERIAVATRRLLLLVGCVLIFEVDVSVAQEVRSSADLELRALDATRAVDALRIDMAAKVPRTANGDDAKSTILLDKASDLLSDVADKAARGATASETRSDMIGVARLLNHAYLAAKEQGEYPQADLVDAVESLMRDVDAYHNPKSRDED